eukprot:TRINITY_DN13685_c1_g1_i3.p1 TRINITY_DN13685_c1_g1~~TRINITY_DN13685_c1_g1_i3.p1  ORF type:complete len:264 (+),score=46.63 TRINITY_DN13685_c1_g1_i3:75-794(+)
MAARPAPPRAKRPRVEAARSPADPAPHQLAELWATLPSRRVVAFYGHAAGRPYASFSNFAETPYDFRIPMCCLPRGAAAPPPTRIRWSEQGIMLCKARLMGDSAGAAAVMRAGTPFAVKKAGRSVKPWDQSKWDAAVCTIAREVVTQKFRAHPVLARELLGTEDALICEATRRDRVWGVGLDVGDRDTKDPQKWKGKNVLGWALMAAREELGGASAPRPPVATAAAAAAAAAAAGSGSA